MSRIATTLLVQDFDGHGETEIEIDGEAWTVSMSYQKGGTDAAAYSGEEYRQELRKVTSVSRRTDYVTPLGGGVGVRE